MLSDPLLEEMTKWSEEDAKGNTVGNRIKRLFDVEGRGNFQRMRKEGMLDPASTWR